MSGLPYEECKRWRDEGWTLRTAEHDTPPAYALPPFHPDHQPRPRARHRNENRHRRTRSVDGALVSGALTILCVVTLVVTVVVAATLPS
ncbi:hypothetical protein [Streptomyces camelliae]|uniref:DUF2510 domain-containing protein n=1 Tax=Streptomyces camelliae TaxID=3004093 RepID=A0ABY7P681_9ACTN|nr:hypothetical protein [Streptomyces sp. HUAS 2-6]WBO65429.1 hypothetical protein O1G22_22680 [Streptomyces sp. HUAS 2-6]